METVFWKTDWFRVFTFTWLILSLISIYVNYTIIRSRKSDKSVLSWAIIGYVFPVISCVMLNLITKNEMKIADPKIKIKIKK